MTLSWGVPSSHQLSAMVSLYQAERTCTLQRLWPIGVSPTPLKASKYYTAVSSRQQTPVVYTLYDNCGAEVGYLGTWYGI